MSIWVTICHVTYWQSYVGDCEVVLFGYDILSEVTFYARRLPPPAAPAQRWVVCVCSPAPAPSGARPALGCVWGLAGSRPQRHPPSVGLCVGSRWLPPPAAPAQERTESGLTADTRPIRRGKFAPVILYGGKADKSTPTPLDN